MIGKNEEKELQTIIFKMLEYQEKFFNNFHNELNDNMKSLRVEDIVLHDGKINTLGEKIISNYKKNIETFFLNESIESEIIRSRIKVLPSARKKLIKYRFKKEKGKIALNKCLNDFMGVRAILKTYHSKNIDLLLDKITDDFKEHPLRIINSSNKFGYIAIHIYFEYNKNRMLPWELQIWSKLDGDYNDELHRVHKIYEIKNKVER